MSEQKTPRKFVYDFAEGNKDLKDLLGGKGANLAEMTNLGLPVPPGFTITTEACQAYLRAGRRARRAAPTRSASTCAALEKAMGKQLGQPDDPLLVSVRSGAKFSMPGMMETVLNIGLNDESVRGPGRAGRQRAVRVGLLPPADPDVRQDRARHRRRALRGRARRGQAGQGHRRTTSTSTPTTCASWSTTFKDDRRRARRPATFPQDPREQMDLAVRAVFDSWNTERAVLYRRQERIPADLGTAVNVCAMVFGNLGMDSGTGVALHPRPGHRRSRASTATTCRTRRARTSSPASATRCRWPTWSRSTRRPTTSCWRSWRRSRSTTATCATSSSPSSAASCGCCRPGSASAPPAAAFRIATQLVDEGLIDMDEALHAGDRRAAGAADVPALRRRRPTHAASPRA